MSRINTNVQSLISQRVLGKNNQQLNQSLERLSTGLRINSGKDDPAGLIASEKLKSQTAGLTAAIDNANRADQVVNIAEGGLQEVNSLLLDVQGLVNQSANDAGLSEDEKQANQLQINSILSTIDRISQSTSFQGTKLLNGSFDYQISDQNTNVEGVKVNAAKLENDDTRDVKVVVTNSAQRAGVFLSLGGTSLDLSASDAQLTFEVAGADGSRQFSFASGTAVSSVASTINTFTSVTGVSATANGSSVGISLNSTDFGSNQFVSVNVADDGGQAGGVYKFEDDDANAVDTSAGTDFSAATNTIRDAGQDLGAIINGVQATANGATAQITNDFLDVEVNLSDTGAQQVGSIDAFTIDGGGAKFNLGPRVDISNQVSLGIGSVASRKLGSISSGYLDKLGSGQSSNVVDGDLSKAQDIVNDAINQVSTLRGRLGAFQKNTIGSTINSLNVALENTQAAQSSITDTDFAKETAALTRNQILVSAATNTLKLANSQPQSALQLLG